LPGSVTFHDLRVKAVQEALGHANASEALDT
jgi:hypothetical protein